MEKDFKRPPFTLDRSHGGTLVGQLAAALRQAIETGYYRAGDMLPPTRDLAAILGVSRIVAIRAMRRLAELRLIVQRPHVGSIVCAKGRPLWKGQVLIVVPPGIGNLGDNATYAVLRDALTANGYLPLTATVLRTVEGKFDFALLDTVMRQQIDLVVQLHDQPEIARWLSRKGVPFIRFTKKPLPIANCVGCIERRDDLALADFLAHCRRNGVKRVVEVRTMRNGPDAVSALKAMGVRATSLRITPPDGRHDAGGLVQLAIDRFAGWLKGGAPLPDLLFFRDDHLTAGALLALAAAGVRIPEDVRIVTWANRYYGPSFIKPLTRMEQDNVAVGETVAKAVLDHLRTGAFPASAVVGPTYVKGETF